jgi:hypothetical protein
MRAGDDAERGNDEVGAPPACVGGGTTHLWGKEQS